MAAKAAAAAPTSAAAASAEKANQAALSFGSGAVYAAPKQNEDVFFPPYVPPEVAAFNSELEGATAVSPEGKLPVLSVDCRVTVPVLLCMIG